jgi:hypothetical protein
LAIRSRLGYRARIWLSRWNDFGAAVMGPGGKMEPQKI